MGAGARQVKHTPAIRVFENGHQASLTHQVPGFSRTTETLPAFYYFPRTRFWCFSFQTTQPFNFQTLSMPLSDLHFFSVQEFPESPESHQNVQHHYVKWSHGRGRRHNGAASLATVSQHPQTNYRHCLKVTGPATQASVSHPTLMHPGQNSDWPAPSSQLRPTLLWKEGVSLLRLLQLSFSEDQRCKQTFRPL